MTAVLDIQDLTLDRGGRQVLHGVSLGVAPGEIVALLGANGAGKSSLVLGAVGLLPLTGGTVTSDGRELTGLPPNEIRAAGIAAVPEGHHVLGDLTVDENLQVAGAHLSLEAAADGVIHAYRIFPELSERPHQKASSLSGGQQQMVVLGQAMVSRPKVVLADEMSLGLAPLVVKRLLEVVTALRDEGIGVLLIEQFTHLALGLADRIYVMDRGRITFEGTPAEVEANPDILREAYLAGHQDGG